MDAIAELPPQRRIITYLKKVEGWTSKEVADLLRLAPGTVDAATSAGVRAIYAAVRRNGEVTGRYVTGRLRRVERAHRHSRRAYVAHPLALVMLCVAVATVALARIGWLGPVLDVVGRFLSVSWPYLLTAFGILVVAVVSSAVWVTLTLRRDSRRALAGEQRPDADAEDSAAGGAGRDAPADAGQDDDGVV